MMFALISACGGGNGDLIPEDSVQNGIEATSTNAQEPGVHDQTDTQKPADTETSDGEGGPDREETNEEPDLNDSNTQLLQSASVDLNNDGHNEQVEAVQVTLKKGAEENSQAEGLLRIKEGDSEKQLSFSKKDDRLSSLLTSMEFEDLDGDGSKDIFMIIPGSGASFSYSNYFIYSYMKDASYTFTSDNTLAEFIDGFKPAYINGGNKLTLLNDKYDFSADLLIEDVDQLDLETTMDDYVNSVWIEPVCINISDNSRLMMKKGAGGKPEIKVPLPIFGLATVDMIGEIDLFFTIDSSFRPVLAHFEVLDFVGRETVKVGSWDSK